MALHVPIDLDERIIDRIAETDRLTGAPIADPVISGLSNAVKLAREQAHSLAAYEAAAHADKTMTFEANLLRVAGAAEKSGSRVATLLDAARTRAITEIANIEKRTGTPPPPKDSIALSMEAEIRARLGNMPPKHRTAAIAKAKAENNEAIIGAVLRGQPLLTGLTETQQDAMRHHYRERFHSADYARLSRLKRALEAVDKSGRLFVKIVRDAVNTPAAMQAASNKAVLEESAAAHAREA
ncbi:hypothetical protein EN925_15060 [Mesorhizobium sp. M7A.F.Ca.US.006.04.2.1]|uniref:hypothetical protein n=1 Tax=unclassified Mesorhizobium TaxID=325217 RepID=UPI000FCAE3D9|nr:MULTISPECIES: hypothetical protein [unclassified Mesorhizobium]RUX73896.1 hypothetical protein EN990_19670 [Mesorhizobium sp. M7A.F.Ca.US.005.03.1.1]RUY18460.1 hypothetical protein EN991_04090 [Mesorhizobium sp. M7A.F.Ca.US.005.03.2.1]RVA90406.1 hypothetical protein EN925_15060 [Mesorhizobium sp. M7A.F.Ca.US.006.04.2.1]